MKEIGKYTFIVLFNILAIVGVLYAVEYLFSPFRALPKDGTFGEERYTWGHLVVNNRYGFRERDFETPKPEGVYRVMVLGDSFTWGDGLAVEERYTSIAESLLNETSMGVEFEVLNFGLRGMSTIAERDVLNKYINAVDPDLIVVGFTLNDPQPKEQDYSVERQRLDERGGWIVRKLAYRLHHLRLRYIAKSLHDAFYLTFERWGVIPDWRTALQRAYDESSEEWISFIRALQDIKEISDQMGLPAPIFIILNEGTSADQPTDYGNPDPVLEQYLHWYHQAEAAALEAGFLVYDHEREIAEQLSDEPLTINRLDHHPSVNLNRIYGEKLYQTIVGILTQDQ